MAIARRVLADLAANLFTDTVNANASVAMTTASTIIYIIDIDNTANNAAASYVKLYNTAGAVTVGTTVPDVVLMMPAGLRRELVIAEGYTLATGVAIATVTVGGTTGTTSPTNSVIVRIAYT